MNVDVIVYDAFTQTPHMGNPAGIVLDAGELSDLQMQEIAKILGYNETAFVLPGNQQKYRIRFFTPRQEVPICGHATIATMSALSDIGLVSSGEEVIETGIGELKIGILSGKHTKIRMQQSLYQEKAFGGSREDIAQVIGLKAEELDEKYPICYASTGLWTLLVPIKKLDSFQRMTPKTNEFPLVLEENPRASIHPFCLETFHKECTMHGRHFSSPFSGTVEDVVTGTASGAMGGYYQKHIRSLLNMELIRVEQGLEIGRDGVVEVIASQTDSNPITILGTAVFSKKQTVVLK